MLRNVQTPCRKHGKMRGGYCALVSMLLLAAASTTAVAMTSLNEHATHLNNDSDNNNTKNGERSWGGWEQIRGGLALRRGLRSRIWEAQWKLDGEQQTTDDSVGHQNKGIDVNNVSTAAIAPAARMDISLSKTQQFSVACVARTDGRAQGGNDILVYRVLMYPKQYPHWPYLLYGRIRAADAVKERLRLLALNNNSTEGANATLVPAGCLMSASSLQLYVAFDEWIHGALQPTGRRHVAVFTRRLLPDDYDEKTDDLLDRARRGRPLSWQLFESKAGSEIESTQQKGLEFFDMVHARDGYNDVWVLNKSFGTAPDIIDGGVVRESSSNTGQHYLEGATATTLVETELFMDEEDKDTWVGGCGVLEPASVTFRESPDGDALAMLHGRHVVFRSQGGLSADTLGLSSESKAMVSSFVDSRVVFGACVHDVSFLHGGRAVVLLADGTLRAAACSRNKMSWQEVPIEVQGYAEGRKFSSVAATLSKACSRHNDTQVPSSTLALAESRQEDGTLTSAVHFLTDAYEPSSSVYGKANSAFSEPAVSVPSVKLVTIQAVFTDDPLIISLAFSGDGELLSGVGKTSSVRSRLLTWRRVKDVMFRAAPVRFEQAAVVVGQFAAGNTAVFNFERYYIAAPLVVNSEAMIEDIALDFALWLSPQNLTAPRCDPLARLNSFYLPPAPELLEGRTARTREFDGIWQEPWAYAWIVIFVVAYLLIRPLLDLERRASTVIGKIATPRLQTAVVAAGSFVILGLSLFEIAEQPAYVNDWPAHLHHVEEWVESLAMTNANVSAWDRLVAAGDYNQFMHYHGPNTYAAGFLYLYTPIYWLTGGSLAAFQLLWACIETATFYVVYGIARDAGLSAVPAALLPIISNRLHLYNVRVVINDISAVLPMLIVVWWIMRTARKPQRAVSWKSHVAASVLYSFVLANKLNFVFFGPGLAMAYMLLGGFWYMIAQGCVVFLTQILLALPFITANWQAYLRWAYDVRRELLWEKTRNMKFVGREMYGSQWFGLALLAISAALVIGYAGRIVYVYYLTPRRADSPARGAAVVTPGVILHTFAFCNFVFVALARGLYTPFLCWYFYLFPSLCTMADFPVTYVVGLFVAHEYLFRFFPFSLAYEMLATWVYLLTNVLLIVRTFAAAPVLYPQTQTTTVKEKLP